MASHNIGHKIFEAQSECKDPGASGTFAINQSVSCINLVSAAAEARTMPDPAKAGCLVLLHHYTDGGDITVTFSTAFTEDGATTFVFSEVGQMLLLMSVRVSASALAWRKISDYGIGNLALADTAVLDDLSTMAATAAEIDAVADVSTRIITLVASGAISQATHEGKTLLLGEVGGNALCAMTLPAATGSGARYLFRVSVVNTSNYTITTNGTDVFNGTILNHDIDITDGTLLHAFPATTQTIITLNGSTTGGSIIGDYVEIEDILTGKWFVTGIVSCAAGSNPATPFS